MATTINGSKATMAMQETEGRKGVGETFDLAQTLALPDGVLDGALAEVTDSTTPNPWDDLDSLLQAGAQAIVAAEQEQHELDELGERYEGLVGEVEAIDQAIVEVNLDAATKQDLITSYVGKDDDIVIVHLPEKESDLLERLTGAEILKFPPEYIKKIVELRAAIIRFKKIEDKNPEQQGIFEQLLARKKEFDTKARQEAIDGRVTVETARAKEEKVLKAQRTKKQKEIKAILNDNPKIAKLAQEKQDTAKKAELNKAVRGLTEALGVFESVDAKPVEYINGLMEGQVDTGDESYFDQMLRLSASKKREDKEALKALIGKGSEVLVAKIKEGEITDAKVVVGSAANRDTLNRYITADTVLSAQLEDPITLRELANVDVEKATTLEVQIKRAVAIKSLIFRLTGNKPSKSKKDIKVGAFWQALNEQTQPKAEK